MILSKDNIDIGLIAASGQVFRIRDEKDGEFTAIHKEHVLHISDLGNEYELSCTEAEFEKVWKNYFDMDTDYEKLIKEIDPKDTFLKNAAEFGHGIRILNQDPWEATLCFIISQNNNIAIKIKYLFKLWKHAFNKKSVICSK